MRRVSSQTCRCIRLDEQTRLNREHKHRRVIPTKPAKQSIGLPDSSRWRPAAEGRVPPPLARSPASGSRRPKAELEHIAMLAVKLPFTASGKLTPKVMKPRRIARNAQVIEMPTPLDPNQLLDALPRSWLVRFGFVLLFLLVWFGLQFPLVPTTALGFAVNVAFCTCGFWVRSLRPPLDRLAQQNRFKWKFQKCSRMYPRRFRGRRNIYNRISFARTVCRHSLPWRSAA